MIKSNIATVPPIIAYYLILEIIYFYSYSYFSSFDYAVWKFCSYVVFY
jgi:hypothetical protein